VTVTLTDTELMILAAKRIEELLQDLSQACGGMDSYDHGTAQLVKALKERGS
jgi:hypothetical protein